MYPPSYYPTSNQNYTQITHLKEFQNFNFNKNVST